MDFEKLTNKSKELVQDVVNLASRKKHQYIAPEHLQTMPLNGFLRYRAPQCRA